MHINNYMIEKEQDWSTHKEQSSDPLLHYLYGYPAKYSILDTQFPKWSQIAHVTLHLSI